MTDSVGKPSYSDGDTLKRCGGCGKMLSWRDFDPSMLDRSGPEARCLTCMSEPGAQVHLMLIQNKARRAQQTPVERILPEDEAQFNQWVDSIPPPTQPTPETPPGTKFCARCNTIKPFREFQKDARFTDGLYDWCLVCQRQQEFDRKYLGKAKAQKRCPGCSKIRPEKDFYSNWSNTTTLSTYCKACVKQRKAAYFLAHKTTIRRKNRERYHIVKFLTSGHPLAKLFRQCGQCKRYQLILSFSDPLSNCCDICRAKNK